VCANVYIGTHVLRVCVCVCVCYIPCTIHKYISKHEARKSKRTIVESCHAYMNAWDSTYKRVISHTQASTERSSPRRPSCRGWKGNPRRPLAARPLVTHVWHDSLVCEAWLIYVPDTISYGQSLDLQNLLYCITMCTCLHVYVHVRMGACMFGIRVCIYIYLYVQLYGYLGDGSVYIACIQVRE